MQIIGKKLGCVQLHILEQQYKRTELKVSYRNKELTLKNSAVNERSNTLILFVDPDGREIWIAFDVTNKDGSTSVQKVQYKEGKLYGRDGKEYTGANAYATKVQGHLNQLAKDNTDLKDRINTLEGSKNIHTIQIKGKMFEEIRGHQEQV